MDPSEPHWRTNSSFSPPSSRRWDHRSQSDGVSHRLRDAPYFVSSLSSHSKDSISGLNNDQYSNHHHSVSDGALSYIGSPSDNSQAIRWMPTPQKYDLGEFSTPSAGVRSEVSLSSRVSKRYVMGGSNFCSPSQLPGSSRWASSSKPPIFPPRHFSGRRSFMSKPVYPLVLRNPVSDAETPEASNGDRWRLDYDNRSSPIWQGGILSSEEKFHRALTELEKMEASPDLNMSSRREGFRWSNASSYDFGYGADVIDMTDHIGIENQRVPNSSLRYQKCALCERLLWRKSPWSSHQIFRNSDMSVAGILACHHVFHADCLEETTSKSQIHDPPCPVCLRTVDDERSTPLSEPLQVALKSLRRNQVADLVSDVASSSNTRNEGNLKRSHTLAIPWKSSSLIKNRFKKRFSGKGK